MGVFCLFARAGFGPESARASFAPPNLKLKSRTWFEIRAHPTLKMVYFVVDHVYECGLQPFAPGNTPTISRYITQRRGSSSYVTEIEEEHATAATAAVPL